MRVQLSSNFRRRFLEILLSEIRWALHSLFPAHVDTEGYLSAFPSQDVKLALEKISKALEGLSKIEQASLQILSKLKEADGKPVEGAEEVMAEVDALGAVLDEFCKLFARKDISDAFVTADAKKASGIMMYLNANWDNVRWAMGVVVYGKVNN